VARLLKKFPDFENKGKLFYHRVGEMLKEQMKGKQISP